jgi:hypothetical protein
MHFDAVVVVAMSVVNVFIIATVGQLVMCHGFRHVAKHEFASWHGCGYI